MMDKAELGAFAPVTDLLVVPDNGTIVVAGAFSGKYIQFLHEKFPTARIIGYESQLNAFMDLRDKFIGNEKIEIHQCGLATASRTMTLADYDTDGGSVISTKGERHRAVMIDAVTAFHGIGESIDLFVLNVEGSEFALIPYMLNEMMHHRIASLAIQFHLGYVSKKCEQRVLEQLEEYYDRPYSEYPVWCYFVRKNEH